MDTCYLIDFQSIARPIFEANVNGDVTRTSGEIIQRIRNMGSGRLHTALCCDSGRSWRKDVAPDYKANRKETPPSLAHQFGEALDALRLDGYPIYTQEGFEADDIIACAINAVFPHVGHFIVISGDKDMHQIVSEMVTVRRPAFQKYAELDFTPQTVMDKYGLEPKQLVDYFTLVGDASDNVRGAEGIGEKTATPLLATFRTLDAALQAAQEEAVKPEKDRTRLKAGTIKSLLEFAPRASLARQLIRLRTDGCTIDFSGMLTPRTPLDVAEFDGSEDIAFAMPTLEASDGLREISSDTVNGRNNGSDSGSPEAGRERSAAPLQPDLRDSAPNSQPATERPSDSANKELVGQQPTPKKPEPLKFDAKPSAMVPYEPQSQVVQVGRFLQPRSLFDANNLALAVAKSRLYAGINGPGSAEAALVKMVAGEELGIQAMASLNAFHDIEGKPTLAASAIHSLMLRARVVDYFYCKEHTDKSATFVGRRKAEGYPEESVTYTVEDAARAWSKDKNKFILSGWGRNPGPMCIARALTGLARLIAPDVLEGHYAKEEFDE